MTTSRLPRSAHTSRPWRIHEFTPDFHVEDVWALPTPGGRDDFPALVHGAIAFDTAESSSRTVRGLFALRWKLGEIFGWDGDDSGLGRRVPTLSERLPRELRETAPDPHPSLPFTPLYLLEDEYAAELANRTVHGVLHLSWVPTPDGGYRGQMAVLVKRNGLFGAAYMGAITPFRYLIVYPTMIREIEREWPNRLAQLRNPG
ncbi:MAG TPA: DUF2867 domain-containing protein [Solirubrobacterales bacterium]